MLTSLRKSLVMLNCAVLICRSYLYSEQLGMQEQKVSDVCPDSSVIIARTCCINSRENKNIRINFYYNIRYKSCYNYSVLICPLKIMLHGTKPNYRLCSVRNWRALESKELNSQNLGKMESKHYLLYIHIYNYLFT